MNQKEKILKSDAPTHSMSDGTVYKGLPGKTWVRVESPKLKHRKDKKKS